jgi:hypothetical protein
VSIARYNVWDHTSGGYCDPHLAADCAECRKEADEGDWVKYEDAIRISRADAEAIAEMASVCFSEGQGPDCSDLLHRIRGQYPDIAKKFGWVPEFAEARVFKVILSDGISTKDGLS